MSKINLRTAALALLLGVSLGANAGVVSFTAGRITNMLTYTTYGNGDIAIFTQFNAPGCDGVWFRTTEQNGKEIYAQLVAAQLAEKPMSMLVYDDQLWSGSASRFCRIYAISTTG